MAFTRVGRVVIMFDKPAGLDAPNGPGGPDATLDEMIASSITRLRTMPTT